MSSPDDHLYDLPHETPDALPDAEETHADDPPSQTESKQRPGFRWRFGPYMTFLGCALGTGNIWRFPRIVAINSNDTGGLTFILMWLFFLVFWSTPMLVIEFAIGRFYRLTVVEALRSMVSERVIFGSWMVGVAVLVSRYYSVILGWSLYYAGYYMFRDLPETYEESLERFHYFTLEADYRPVLMTAVAIILAGLCVLNGVRWIEVTSVVLVSLLLLVTVILFFISISLKHASHGIRFMIYPCVEPLTDVRTWIEALSQNAFDTGAGMGLMVSYASYLGAKEKIGRYSLLIPIMNAVVSVTFGFALFACVFSTLISTFGNIRHQEILKIFKEDGPGNTGVLFVWLPFLLRSIGNESSRKFVAVLFYIGGTLAGLTSLMANIELFARTLQEFKGSSGSWHMSRWSAVVASSFGLFLLSLPTATNVTLVENQDFVWGYALIVCGLLLACLVMSFGVKRFRQDLIKDERHRYWSYLWSFWSFVASWILFLEGLLMLIAWGVAIGKSDSRTLETWGDVGYDTFVTAVAQWLALVVVIVLLNFFLVQCQCCFVAEIGEEPPEQATPTGQGELIDNENEIEDASSSSNSFHRFPTAVKIRTRHKNLTTPL